MDKYYTYKLLHPITKVPYYIGKGKNKRCFDHFKPHNTKENTPKNNMIKKLLKEFSLGILKENIEIVEYFEDEELAYVNEAKLIKEIGTKYVSTIKDGSLKNMTKGGEGASLLGKKNGMYGKTHTPEARRIFSIHAKKHSYKNKFFSKGSATKEELKARAINSAKSRKKNYKKLSKDEQLKQKIKISEAAIQGYKNMSKEAKYQHKINSTKWMTDKSAEEMKEINKRKASKGIKNGRANMFKLKSPAGCEFTVNMLSGLKDFCKEHNLIYNVIYRYRNNNTVPQPQKTDTKYYKDKAYRESRNNSTGWKITKIRINKI